MTLVAPSLPALLANPDPRASSAAARLPRALPSYARARWGEPVVGLLLAGGRSARMGADKARLELAGRPLIAYAHAALAGCVERVFVAVGSAERVGWDQERRFGEPVFDRAPNLGPLAGLEAGLTAARACVGEGWVCVVACDMPRATGALFRALLDQARERAADVCLVSGPRGVEPLLGVYHTRVLPAVRAALDAGERRSIGFHAFPLDEQRGHSRALRVEPWCTPVDAAVNLNTPDELEAERRARAAALGGGGIA